MASRFATISRRRLSTSGRQSHRGSRNNAAAGAAEAWKAKVARNFEMVAVSLPLGVALAGVALGVATMKGQLSNSPSVRVSKKMRGMMPEVELPEQAAEEGRRYVNRSFFRKLAHSQDFDAVRSGVSDPTRPDNALQKPRHVESLKSSGVDSN